MARSAEELNDILGRTIEEARRHFRVEAAYLFGSYAQGKPHEWSDIDIALFSPDAEEIRLEDKIRHLARIRLAIGAEIELHLYSDKKLKNPPPASMSKHILATGRKIA